MIRNLARALAPLVFSALLLTSCGQVLTAPPPTPTVPPTTVPLVPVAVSTPSTRTAGTPVPRPTEPSPTPEPTATPLIYVIEPGDTLLAIAARFGTTTNALQLANPPLRPEFLQIGQRVVIPVSEEQLPSQALFFTPTPLPLAAQGIGLYITPVGGVWVLGEVLNHTSSWVEHVRVAVAVTGSDGASVAGDAWVALDFIPPGGTAPFGVLFDKAPAEIVSHQVWLLSAEQTFRAESWFPTLLVSRQRGAQAGSVYRVTGTLENISSFEVVGANIVVTLYSREGQVTGYWRQTLPALLTIGAEHTFDLRLSPAGSDTQRYVIAAEGRPRLASD